MSKESSFFSSIFILPTYHNQVILIRNVYFIIVNQACLTGKASVLAPQDKWQDIWDSSAKHSHFWSYFCLLTSPSPLPEYLDLAFRTCPVLSKSEKAHFTLSLPLSTAVKPEEVEDFEKYIVSDRLGKKSKMWNVLKPHPLSLNPWLELNTPKMGPNVQTREVLEMPSSSGSSVGKGKSWYSERVWKFGFFLPLCRSQSLLSLSHHTPLPFFLFLPFPLFYVLPLSNLVVVTASHKYHRSQDYERGAPSSAFSGAIIPKGGSQPPLLLFSLSFLSLICRQSHGSA